MAYEALIVIGFGVALAVVSVSLFVAHVKRINAPNRADPAGTVVHIELGDALAKDEAARRRKVSGRRNSSISTSASTSCSTSSNIKGLSGESSGSPFSTGAFALQQDGVGRRRKRPSAARATNPDGEGAGRGGAVTIDETSAAEGECKQVRFAKPLNTPDRDGSLRNRRGIRMRSRQGDRHAYIPSDGGEILRYSCGRAFFVTPPASVQAQSWTVRVQ